MAEPTLEGLWTVEFASSKGIYGGGVAVFQDNRIMGGDGGFFYLGSYQQDGNLVRATVQVVPFIEGYESAFKTIGRSFLLEFEGTVTDETHAVANGYAHLAPYLELALKLIKRS